MFRLYDFSSFFQNFGFEKSSIEKEEKGRERLNKFFDNLNSQLSLQVGSSLKAA